MSFRVRYDGPHEHEVRYSPITQTHTHTRTRARVCLMGGEGQINHVLGN